VVTVEHLAVWTRDAASLDRLRDFYAQHFGATATARYASARRPGFLSYFLSFPGGGTRVELMTASGVAPASPAPGGRAPEALGYAHLALRLGSREAVDATAARLRAAGVPVESGPRTTGDGYYEALVRDPDGNAVEIMA
jgi:lactoylglutathione lyase